MSLNCSFLLFLKPYKLLKKNNVPKITVSKKLFFPFAEKNKYISLPDANPAPTNTPIIIKTAFIILSPFKFYFISTIKIQKPDILFYKI